MARSMKDSGVEWIGKIPERWSAQKLKYIGRYINGFAFKPDEWGNDGKPIIRIQDLTGSSDNPNFYAGEIDSKYNVTKGDILVSWAATLDAFIWNKCDSWLNQHIFKAIPNENIVLKSYFFWLIKEAMKNMNNENKHGIVMQHVTLDVFNNFVMPIPPLEEQRKLSVFLENKCSAINDIITKTQESIEEYKKLKQAVITEAVTKGVRGKRLTKDSGIEWIGQIPKEWNVIALRYIGQCQNGISKGAEYFGTGYPFISYSDVYKNIELPQIGSSLVESSDEEREHYSVRYGDIFFTRTSETIEEIGFTSVCLKTIENATFAGFLIRVRPYDDTLNPAFAKYYFRSDIHRRYFVKEMIIVIRASLGQELLKKLPVLIPSQEEQREIADYLDKKCTAIDTLIEKKQRFIEELTAYKKSLIYEYVTGKKEVPA